MGSIYYAYNKFDIIWLSKAYLNSTTPYSTCNNKLQILRYTLIRSDYSSNTKRGGVCTYYKSYLPFRVINTNYSHKCLSIKLKSGDKICNFPALYESSSQSQNDFETLAHKFEMTLEILAQRSFSHKSHRWISNLKTGITCFEVTQWKISLHCLDYIS